jgi:hypothetical protein
MGHEHMKKTKKHDANLKNKAPTSNRLVYKKMLYWLLGFIALVAAWAFLNSTEATGIPTKGIVSSVQNNARTGQLVTVVKMRDGSELRLIGIATPVGGQIDCTRFPKKYLPSDRFECP